MTLKSLYLQSGAYNAVDDRLLGGMLLDISTDPLSGSGRIFTGFGVSAQATPNMTVLVSTGRAVCPTPASDGGGYVIVNDATLTVTVPPVSTLGRVDLVLLAVDDADYSGAIYGPKVYVLTGTPAGSPVAPTQPAGTVLLATLTHLANATSVANSAIAFNFAGNVHEAEYYATVIQSIPSGTDRPVAFGVVAGASPDVTKGTSTSGAIPDARFQLNRSGLWSLDAGIRLQTADAASGGIWLGVDGTGAFRFASAINNQGGTANMEVSAHCIRRFGAGTGINVNCWHSAATAKNTDPFNQSVHFRLSWLRP